MVMVIMNRCINHTHDWVCNQLSTVYRSAMLVQHMSSFFCFLWPLIGLPSMKENITILAYTECTVYILYIFIYTWYVYKMRQVKAVLFLRCLTCAVTFFFPFSSSPSSSSPSSPSSSSSCSSIPSAVGCNDWENYRCASGGKGPLR